MRFGIAVIGIGKIAREAHLPAITRDPRFKLVATVDPAAPGYSGVPHFETHAALLAQAPDLGLDAVAICTPPTARYAMARACLVAGVHTLLEKPPAATVGEVDALVLLAQQAQVTLFTAWHARANAAVTAAAEWLSSRRLRALRVCWYEDVRQWHPGQDWIWEPGGLGVFDAGINALSILTRIVPATLIVRAAELHYPVQGQTPVAARLQLASAAVEQPVDVRFDWRGTGPESWTLCGETSVGERFELLDGGARLLIDGAARTVANGGEYPALYRRFGDLMTRGGSDVDRAPLQLTADAFLIGRRVMAGPFPS